MWLDGKVSWRSIYIPLCFYFILLYLFDLAVDQHLHSTMLLLYLHIATTHAIRKSKFTFHYASTLSFTRLYVPIVICRFTFHYASTLSMSSLSHWMMGRRFTFHYASTLSIWRLKMEFINEWFTFHYASTLSRYFFSTDINCIIYIPLCFYFIRISHIAYAPYLWFTFHYASTLSSAPVRSWHHLLRIYIPLCFYFICAAGKLVKRNLSIYIPLCFYFIFMHLPSQPGIPHLHSTMLLLYLEQPDEMGAYDRIYIPLCFYFIHFLWSITILCHLYLHSTMLLLYRDTA